LADVFILNSTERFFRAGNEGGSMTTILSYGGGVNSTALLLEWLRRGNSMDALIFADPGSERPETYDYIEQYIKPFCKEQDIIFHTVRYITKDGVAEDIYSGYFKNNSLPAVQQRSCTQKWKIAPIEKLIKDKYKDSQQLIGIDYGEKHRAKIIYDPKTGEKMYLYPEKSYPLVDWKITREECKTIIEAHGWPVPIKSGCYFCPFQKRTQWKGLYDDHPSLYAKAEEMELNARKFPKYMLMMTNPKRLDWFRRGLETQTTLDSYTDSEEAASVPCVCYDG